MRKIGVLTGGGDCPGLNAAIRAVVKTAIRKHGAEVVGFLDGYEGLVENRSRALRDADVSNILLLGGTILGTSNRANPFDYIGPDGKKTDRSKDVLANVERHGLDALVVIGGDGTFASARKFSAMGLAIAGVPKTIDNDLAGTDPSIGFNTALSVATDAVDRLHSTAISHHRVMVLELMGRYAGWLTIRAGIAGGGDVLLIPEIPFDMASVCDAVRARAKRGKRFSLVVVAEGAKEKGGRMVIQQIVANSPDPVRLGGIGPIVAKALEAQAGVEARATVLGHVQRGGSPTAFDRWLATNLGTLAVDLLAEGKRGFLAAHHEGRFRPYPLSDIPEGPRLVDPAGTEVASARAVGTSFGD